MRFGEISFKCKHIDNSKGSKPISMIFYRWTVGRVSTNMLYMLSRRHEYVWCVYTQHRITIVSATSRIYINMEPSSSSPTWCLKMHTTLFNRFSLNLAEFCQIFCIHLFLLLSIIRFESNNWLFFFLNHNWKQHIFFWSNTSLGVTLNNTHHAFEPCTLMHLYLSFTWIYTQREHF